MSLREEFVRLAHRGRHPITELCQVFGVSEKTGHKWLVRYAAEGGSGLADRSHAPHTPAHQLAPPVVDALLALRAQHPTWGPRKLRAYLAAHQPRLAWPAVSTIGALLARHGLVRRRRCVGGGPARWAPLDQPLTRAHAPNAVWTTDFKGEFRVGSGQYCHPLTVLDAHSRYLLGCQALAARTTPAAQRVFTRLFGEYGMPRVIRSDNGSPFASPLALGRLSQLAVWWIRLGIRPERIAPGEPAQNGAHERMHRTLKAETTRPAAATLAAQQRRFAAFRVEYNTERPHEALGLTAPATHYTASPRPWPRRLPVLEYPATAEVRRVQCTGIIKWRRGLIRLTSVLGGQEVALEMTSAEEWTVAFGPLVLGTVDERTRRFTPGTYWKLDHMETPPTS